MKQKLTVEFDHEVGYAIIKCDWSERWAAQNWDYWVEKIKPIIGVGCFHGILYDKWEQVAPTTISLRYKKIEQEIKGDM